MPHLTVHALEDDLAGRETAAIEQLTDAVVAVYGDWARDTVDIRLVGVPHGRWGIGGKIADSPAPSVTFGIRAAAFERPDAGETTARLVSGVTDAIASVFGEQVRPGVTVDLVAVPAERTGVGGVLPAP